MKETIEVVLDDERRQAKVLEDNGHGNDARLLRRVCDRVARAAEEYLSFLNETEASLRTGRSSEWLRTRFPGLEARGQAKKLGGKRFYREMALEPRGDLAAARLAGRRAAEESVRSSQLKSPSQGDEKR